MKNITKLMCATAAVAVAGTGAGAAGLDRSGQPINILFEEGRYVEVGVGRIFANVDGEDPLGNETGDGPEDYTIYSGGYKADINDQWSYAFILDQPYGSDTSYPDEGSIFDGTSSDLNSQALTGLLRYRMQSGFSVYGGLKLQRVEAEATVGAAQLRAGTSARLAEAGVPAAAIPGIVANITDYTVDADPDIGFGYVAGVAYERPEIALRVALTYHSEVEHRNDTVENGVFIGSTGAPVAVTDQASTSETEFPDAFTLDFQTGVAPNTLVFGRIRYADYEEFELAPQAFTDNTGAAIASYEENIFAYQLGVGRRLTDNFSMSFAVSYEEEGPADDASPLTPVNGRIGYTLGGVYERDQMKITAGISYTDLGDVTNDSLGTFEDNDALAVGIRVGFRL